MVASEQLLIETKLPPSLRDLDRDADTASSAGASGSEDENHFLRMPRAETRSMRWTANSLPWSELQREQIADSEEWFYLLTTASFIEITSDTYAGNLAQHFAGDDEICRWLVHRWEPEELQHGTSLRRYVREVWPGFDWDTQYSRFKAEYEALCKPENLQDKRSLEMASRCVVEMGTSCYYRALHQACAEPVLATMLRNIYEDEVNHYKHFYRYFMRYREQDGVSRTQVASALWHRLKLIESEDSYIALKHVYRWRHPLQSFDTNSYKAIMRQCRRLVDPHFPVQLSAKMLLKPLDLPAPAARVAIPVLEGMTRLVMH